MYLKLRIPPRPFSLSLGLFRLTNLSVKPTCVGTTNDVFGFEGRMNIKNILHVAIKTIDFIRNSCWFRDFIRQTTIFDVIYEGRYVFKRFF